MPWYCRECNAPLWGKELNRVKKSYSFFCFICTRKFEKEYDEWIRRVNSKNYKLKIILRYYFNKLFRKWWK